ncbi:MAG: sulfurtransferase TusA family protein [Promethearchaeota archaeon]|nr:MAG: sulfurtransferase TusA family protein [Candidatus Lokiarchaeota archaeon]
MTDKLDYDYKNIKRIDIRGKVCPMTFVCTKLALEDMKKGEELEIKLDFPAALKSIPTSCRTQKIGKIISIEKRESEKIYWVMKIKKL